MHEIGKIEAPRGCCANEMLPLMQVNMVLEDEAIIEERLNPWGCLPLTTQGYFSSLLLPLLYCDRWADSSSNWSPMSMALTAETTFKIPYDLIGSSCWLGLQSLQKDGSHVRRISASRIHYRVLSCSFTRWAFIGLRELICFTACFLDCILPDVSLCGFPKRCGREGTHWCVWNLSQEAWCCTAWSRPTSSFVADREQDCIPCWKRRGNCPQSTLAIFSVFHQEYAKDYLYGWDRLSAGGIFQERCPIKLL